jgi:hypothetical protein
VEPLEHDRRTGPEGGGDPVGVGRARERVRPPGEVARVLTEPDLPAFPDQPEGGVAEPARADQPLDVRDREEVVEAPLL